MPLGFRIDPEFENHLPKITPEQYAALSVMIELHGPRPGSLVVADIRGDHVLADGHSTYKICVAKQIPLPRPEVIKFANRDQTLEWIEDNQRCRRNMTPAEIQERRKTRIAKAKELREQGQSLRRIAEATGVTQTQAAKDIAAAAGVNQFTPDAPDIGNSEETPKIEGRDGKLYPAQATRSKRAPAGANGATAFRLRDWHECIGRATNCMNKLANKLNLLRNGRYLTHDFRQAHRLLKHAHKIIVDLANENTAPKK